MGIHHQVLGEPGRDNALLARVGTGQATHRLLFDCGEGCLSALSAAEVRAIDALFFSHLHIDHVAGFDGFLRHIGEDTPLNSQPCFAKKTATGKWQPGWPASQADSFDGDYA